MQIWTLFVFVFIWCTFSNAIAQSNEGYKLQMEKWWHDYASYLGNINAEPNGIRATKIVNDMTIDLVPRFGKLIKSSYEWEKSHTKLEIEEMKKWSESNFYAVEVREMATTEKMLIRANTNKSFGNAYMGFTRLLSETGKAAGK